MNINLDPKAKIKAPCKYYDNGGKINYPAVDCAYVCESCGWNPNETRRRMKVGHMVTTVAPGLRIKSLHFPARFSMLGKEL